MSDAPQSAPAADTFHDLALLREKQVLELVPFSSPTLWRRVKDGKFPKPVRITGSRVTCWRWAEVRAWINEQQEAA